MSQPARRSEPTSSTAALDVARLLDAAAYPHPTRDIHLIETHISWVFLTGDYVYKIKKPCNLGFLDFSTVEKRRVCCHEEVRLSGRFAPELYLGVVPITGSPDAPRIDGAGTAFEWAVKLRQFDEACRLDRLFADHRLSADDCRRLGAEIAAVHETLAVAAAASPWGTRRAVREAVALNLEQLRAARPDTADRAERLEAWLDDRLVSVGDAIESRRRAGRIRECHGDLHLANLVLHEGRALAFDAIEFSESLRWIDVASDIAFLAMDLDSRGRPDLAAHAVNGWMEAADDHAAAAVLPVYKVYRAIVRAAVAAIRSSQAADDAAARADTDRYLDLAARLTRPPRPVLFATSGVSGSGKTTISTAVIGGCGAVRLRSDVERKRLAGMAATERPRDDGHARAIYDSATTQRVYERLAAIAATLLAAGSSVVVDATANQREQRDLLAAVARGAAAPLVWLDFDLPADDLLARVAARQAAGTDASDATVEVVRAQLAAREPITPEELAAAGVPTRHVRVTAADIIDPSFIARLVEEAGA